MGTALTAPVEGNRQERPYQSVHDVDAIMAVVCARIEQGESVRAISRSLNLPESNVRLWSLQPEYVAQYARAREIQAHNMAEEIIKIVDAATPEDWQVAKIRADKRQWLLSKVLPKVYGERIEHNVEGTVEHAVTFKVENRKVTAG
jgi:hypothetical protein